MCFGAAPGGLACVETCGPDTGAAYPGYAETPCGNPNSTCQATGAIGDPTTAGVCIPADTFTAADHCPSGTHPMDQGDGTFDCIPPSAVGCNVLDVADDGVANMSTLGTVCSFEHFGQEVTGLCFGAAPGAIACVETCAPDDGSAFPGYNETPVAIQTAPVRRLVQLVTQRPQASVFQRIHSPRLLIVQVVPIQWIRAMAPLIASHQVRSAVMFRMPSMTVSRT